jgi:hypothetical protein
MPVHGNVLKFSIETGCVNDISTHAPCKRPRSNTFGVKLKRKVEVEIVLTCTTMSPPPGADRRQESLPKWHTPVALAASHGVV